MRFIFPEISKALEFGEGYVNCLVIENQKLFSSLIGDIYSQIEGNDGFSVLSVDYTPVDMSKYAELITTFIPFDMNRKNLLNKMLSALEKMALDESNYYKTTMLLSSIENYISDLTFELPCQIDCNRMTVSSLLKSAGIHISGEDGNSLENIVDYMELVREFEKDKLFIFVNMRSYFDNQAMENFFKTVISHKYKVLLIDGFEHQKLDNEIRVIIDSDLCEI